MLKHTVSDRSAFGGLKQCVEMNNSGLAFILANEPDEVAALRETLPPWSVIVGLAGGHILPREKVEAQENESATSPSNLA